MGAIDADAHVIECEATFDYIDAAHRGLKPRVMVDKDRGRLRQGNAGNLQKEYWVVDGRIHTKELNLDINISKGSRELTDVQARLDHMDTLDIDVQVIYPTLFLRAWTRDPLTDAVISNSYNRWMADVWKQAPDRLRWVVIPPLLSMDKVAGELEFAKENGAVGVFVRGLEDDRRLDNPYFFPLFDAAQALGLPICFHAGNGSFAVRDIYASEAGIGRSRAPVIVACESLLLAKLPERFPGLPLGLPRGQLPMGALCAERRHAAQAAQGRGHVRDAVRRQQHFRRLPGDRRPRFHGALRGGGPGRHRHRLRPFGQFHRDRGHAQA